MATPFLPLTNLDGYQKGLPVAEAGTAPIRPKRVLFWMRMQKQHIEHVGRARGDCSREDTRGAELKFCPFSPMMSQQWVEWKGSKRPSWRKARS